MITFGIIGFVPTICWVHNDGELFCNAANGYELVARSAEGSERLIERSDVPAHKRVELVLQDGEVIEIRARN